ncbi:MAG TPA: TadG family pilus assembly protein [Phycisphaerae bacterium]|nr:TadG family pilus assembly protein [Phycisphaerae bacterium]HRY67575.1 TadG family pilus assembly protein [Phycisphaerae bacterium]HSA24962.1 TadG family pilus assembly protein [Phycisphaerae bacterium]
MKPPSPTTGCRTSRRGTAVVLTAISMTVLVGFAALAVDMGILYNVKAELQRTADSAAMAAAWQLLDPERLMGLPDMSEEISAAIGEASAYATRNKVAGEAPSLRTADVVVGYISNPNNLAEEITTGDPSTYNSVQVIVRRDSLQNGPIPLLFGRIFGLTSADVSAKATAVFKDGVIGFRTTGPTDTVDMLPFALHIDSWNDMRHPAHGPIVDNYSYDKATQTVTAGSDGISEFNLYPGAGVDQLPPGNFGTVDLGAPTNATTAIARQIVYGLNETDLAYFGGEIKLGADGTLLLNGDTGLSAGFSDELAAIVGKQRIIPIFSRVDGYGENAMFTIMGFGGIRILNVKLTGAMNKKQVIIQPEYFVENGAIAATGSGTNYFVYQPVRLVR